MNDENRDLTGPENNLEGPPATDAPPSSPTPDLDAQARARQERRDAEDTAARAREVLEARIRALEEQNEELEDELDRRNDLPTAGTSVTSSGSSGESYVVDAGGDPLTFRVVDLDDDGNATGFRIARVIVSGGALTLAEVEPQEPAQMNAAEIDALERRIADLSRGRR